MPLMAMVKVELEALKYLVDTIGHPGVLNLTKIRQLQTCWQPALTSNDWEKHPQS